MHHSPIVPLFYQARSSLIETMSLAAVAAGADGLMIEVHYKPEEALSDKEQTLSPEAFSRAAEKIFALRSFLFPPVGIDA
jgi:3-deoxy-7-phosphoheptulonate synthase